MELVVDTVAGQEFGWSDGSPDDGGCEEDSSVGTGEAGALVRGTDAFCMLVTCYSREINRQVSLFR